VLRFNLPACGERLAAVALALGAGDTAHTAGWNAAAAIDAVASLADRAGMTHRLADFGITAADFDQIAADALDDEVLANTPRMPAATDIRAILQSTLPSAAADLPLPGRGAGRDEQPWAGIPVSAPAPGPRRGAGRRVAARSRSR
jgi:hypothetical protein